MLSYEELARLLTQWRHSEDYGFLAQVPVHPLQWTLKFLDRAIRAAFDKSNPARLPPFKKKNRDEAGLRFADPKQIKLDLSTKDADGRRVLPKVFLRTARLWMRQGGSGGMKRNWLEKCGSCRGRNGDARQAKMAWPGAEQLLRRAAVELLLTCKRSRPSPSPTSSVASERVARRRGTAAADENAHVVPLVFSSKRERACLRRRSEQGRRKRAPFGGAAARSRSGGHAQTAASFRCGR
ncbi:hypothetical protein A7Q09_08235 [Methylacidiphilum sp. Yel]|nr:hypothetical protein A7Q09_08235 [Methylacidiphilum sp. Yel]